MKKNYKLTKKSINLSKKIKKTKYKKQKIKNTIKNKNVSVANGLSLFEINNIKKKFKIMFRGSNELKEKLLIDKNIKNKYYELFTKLYNINILNYGDNNNKSKSKSKSKSSIKYEIEQDSIIEYNKNDPDSINKDKEDNNTYNIIDKIFPFFAKLNTRCIDDKNKKYINLYDNKLEKIHKNILYLQYDKINIYKAMDGFYDIKNENSFIKNNIDIPFWFSSPFYAYKAIQSRNGGINAYSLKKNMKLNIFIVNCENITKIIDICKEILPNKVKIIDAFLSKNYLLDLLRLSSCSEKGLINQMEIFSKFNKYNNELWLTPKPLITSHSLCNLETINTDYFGITKAKGYNNYNFAYLLKYINNIYFENYFDGYIIKHKYTPYFFTGVSLEEMVLFNPYSKIDRDINNIYDWNTYQHKLNFKININLRLQYLLSEYNNNFKLNIFYNKIYNSSNNQNITKIMKKYNNKNYVSIVFLNCNNFKSINMNDTIQDNIIETNKFINFINANIYVLINANQFNIINKYHDHKYIINKNNNYLILHNEKHENQKVNEQYKYNNIIKSINIINIKPKLIYPYKRPEFKDFINITEKNLENFIENADKVLKRSSILYITDNYNITNISPEINYIKEHNFNLVNLNTSFTKSDNFLFVKDSNSDSDSDSDSDSYSDNDSDSDSDITNTNKIVYETLLDFNRSYYLPQLIILEIK